VAKNERTDHRFCQKLPRLPTNQGLPSSTIWAVFAVGATIRTMAVHSNRLHQGTPNLRRLRPDIGNYRPIHQDGALPPLKERREDGGRPGRHLGPRSMKVPRPPRCYRVRPRLQVHFGDLEGVLAALRNSASNVNSVPSTNGRPNGMTQPDNRSLPPSIHYQASG